MCEDEWVDGYKVVTGQQSGPEERLEASLLKLIPSGAVSTLEP